MLGFDSPLTSLILTLWYWELFSLLYFHWDWRRVSFFILQFCSIFESTFYSWVWPELEECKY